MPLRSGFEVSLVPSGMAEMGNRFRVRDKVILWRISVWYVGF